MDHLCGSTNCEHCGPFHVATEPCIARESKRIKTNNAETKCAAAGAAGRQGGGRRFQLKLAVSACACGGIHPVREGAHRGG